MLTLNQITLMRGSNILLKDASLSIYPKQKTGLIGKNGCGKSSLFALLKHEIQLDAGDVNVPQNWLISHVKQETLALDQSAIDYVIDGDVPFRTLQAELAKAEANNQGEKIGELHQKLDAIDAYTINARAGQLLNGLGFSQDKHQSSVRDFSGGWRMRLNLAQALISRSDLLLLDEPTNHLDLDAVIWLSRFLKAYEGTLLLISHDREFLDEVTEQIVHVENSTLTLYKGNYSAFERQRAENLRLQQAMFEKQQREKAHIQSFVDRFKAKASKAKQAQSRLKALSKMEDLAPAHVDSEFNFAFRKPEKNPNPLISLDKVSVGYEDANPILKTIKLNLVPGSRIGLLGRNGEGKSTLVKLLAQELSPLQGDMTVGHGLNIGYFAQHQLEQLRADDSPLSAITRIANGALEQVLRDFLGGFGFKGDQALDPVENFSGGEKARLVLALLVWQKPNLLLLDEPTNHLDLDMRLALTMALQNFEGAMIIVSHDRHILTSTCDDFYLVNQGQVTPFIGDLMDYEKWLSNDAKEQKQQAIAANNVDKEPTISRKDQKRLDAEFRQKTRPIRQAIDKAEKQVEKLQTELDDIEAQLAESEIYQAENKAKLTTLLTQQKDVKQALATVEEAWMEAEEALEVEQEAFNAQV
ncbi:ABC transporter ATP-binding protein [Algibacillus agarilyticus]|uniref:ABC transporter ATP-binding protein n=1 Tax=Algibacillus agarilyticus TaxID=2234133 RepID=UPI000DD005F3|nr:ABC transporter ATP-binding protein [Algibacillus agarilyticus]